MEAITSRDGAVLTMLLSLLHINVNVLAGPEPDRPCPYDGVFNAAMLSVCLGMFLLVPALSLFFPEVLAASPGWRERLAWWRDVLCIVPGAWFQVVAKPSDFFASVAVEGCSMRESGQAQLIWTLGEVLSFGAAVRLLRNASKTTVVVALVSLVPIVWGVEFITTELSDAYAPQP